MKRSTCASGSGYVPSVSMGFCVAMTRKGSSTTWVSPAMVTCRSCITSSSALCTLAGARSHQVRGNEIGGELDAPERAMHCARERLDGQRLGEPRNPFHEEVALG